jgi:cobalt-zinc-cadmium efflux system membrane fusion protein
MHATRRPARTIPMGVMLAVVAAATLPPQSAAQPLSPIASSLDCLIQPSHTVQVGVASAGVMQSSGVERGDSVRKGEVLLELGSRVERAAFALAPERANRVDEVVATKGASELARRELQCATDSAQKSIVTETCFERQRAELDVAEERRRHSNREVEVAAAQLAQRTVVSPIDGVVVERPATQGECIEQRPVLRIAQIDPLRVDVLVPAAAFGTIAVSSKVEITPDILMRQPRVAVVASVDRVVDAASNTFRVRLTPPNPAGKLLAGLGCTASIDLPSGPGERKASSATEAAMQSQLHVGAHLRAGGLHPQPPPSLEQAAGVSEKR